MTDLVVPDIEFLDFKVENGGCIESAHLPLEDQGLVLVRGENLDEGGSNGAGKSTLFDLLSHSVTGTAGKGKTNTNKGISGNDFLPLWNPKGFHTRLHFRVNSDEFYIHHYRKHKEGTRIAIYRNGETETHNITPTTDIKDVQKRVLEYTGLSEREWYGSIYLTQSYSHALVSGTPQQKKQHLAAHFGLDEVDACISVNSKFINGIVLPDMTSLREMAQSCDEQLRLILPADMLTQKQAALSQQASEITTKLVAVGVEINTQEKARTTDEERKRHAQILLPLGYTVESDLAAAIAERRQRVASATKAEEANTQRTSILHQLHAVPDTETESDVSATMNEKTARMGAISSVVPGIQRRHQLQSKLSTVPTVEGTEEALTLRVKSVTKQLTLSEAKVQLARGEVTKLKSLGDKCGACLQEVSAERRDAMIAERLQEIAYYDDVIPKSKMALDAAQKDLAAVTERLRLSSEIVTLPDGDLDALNHEYTEARAIVSSLQTKLTQATTRKNLLTRLQELVVDEGALQDVVHVPLLLGEITLLTAARDFVLRAGNVRFSEEVLLLAMQARTDLTAEHQRVATEAAETAAALSTRRNLEAQKVQIERQLQQHGHEANRKRVLEVLHVVLKDVKAKALRDCTEMLRSSLPLYVKQLFPKGNVSVELDEDEDSLDFYIKKGQQNIALYLASGGQQKRVGLAVLMAFAKLGSKSTNILIADEPYKELDAVGRACAFELFQDLGIPSIYITSHDSDQQQQKKYDRVLTMRMQDGRSQLVNTTEK